MNERIRELALQAGYEPDMFGIGHWDMPECKKFVELIVKNCIETVERHGSWIGVDYIKENFGIE